MKAHRYSQKNGVGTLLYILMIFCMPAGCDLPGETPSGWTEESHGADAAPDYSRLFNRSVVRRIDLVFDPNDWQAMLDNMTQLVGPFGEGRRFPSASQSGNSGNSGEIPDDFEIPPEMSEACEGLSADDVCSFTVMGFSVDGTCLKNPDLSDEMICMPSSEREADTESPDGNSGDSGQMPGIDEIPPEMFDACDGLNVDDECTFTARGGTSDGTCRHVSRLGDRLICADNNNMDLIREDPIYRPCSVKFQGKTWHHVGMRFKGNSSLFFTWGTGSYKFPFRLDFDKFEKDHPETKNQRFYGFEKLTFASGFTDNSLLREQVAADIFRDAGVPAAKTAFYRVYANHGLGPVYFGLYTMIEAPNGPMLGVQFNDEDGNLYKPTGTGATFATFDENAFVKETNEKEADWSDVKAVYDALQADRKDAAAWRSDLESVFDVDGFLQYLGVNNFVMNWDCYGRYPHNYYLYSDSDRMHWIPWDHNMTWMNMPSMDSGPEFPDLSHISEEWPLIRYLLDDPVYFARYLFFVNETLTGVFETRRMTNRFRYAFNLIRPHVVGLQGEKPGYTLLQKPSDFDDSLPALLDFAENRRTVSTQLLSENGFSPSPVVINEIHYNPPSEKSDDYEFIELINIGGKAIDLSGYAFTGIDFTFAADTAIAPGEYVLICKKAKLYKDKAAQVFQWDDGKLSNKGEALSLFDANENMVDYVRFNDGFNWPQNADGEGFSLELRNSASVNSMAENWNALTVGGTPGRANNTSTAN